MRTLFWISPVGCGSGETGLDIREGRIKKRGQEGWAERWLGFVICDFWFL